MKRRVVWKMRLYRGQMMIQNAAKTIHSIFLCILIPESGIHGSAQTLCAPERKSEKPQKLWKS
jgi:hypothetical protein